jgi:hypothetical protein
MSQASYLLNRLRIAIDMIYKIFIDSRSLTTSLLTNICFSNPRQAQQAYSSSLFPGHKVTCHQETILLWLVDSHGGYKNFHLSFNHKAHT